LFLVLGVLGNEECEALIDTTLLEEPVKLFLEVKIESVKLGGDKIFRLGARSENKMKKEVGPEGQCRDRGASNQPQR